MNATAPEIPKFDLQRAVAVLNKAGEFNMLPQGWQMPEAEADKITEAERIVTLARQSHQVREAVGEEQYRAQGGNPEAVTAVLFEADVTGGATPVQVQPPTAPKDVPAPQSIEELAQPVPEEQTNRGQLMQAAGVAPELYETWEDDHGQKWIVETVGVGGFEVRKDGTDEKTIVPVGFLKTKVSGPSSTSQPEQPQPSPSSTQGSPPSSTPGPESSTTTASPPAPPVSSAPSPPESGSSSSSSSDVVLDDDDEGDREYADLLDQVKRDYERANLPLPVDVQQLPQMVEDLTALPDVQQRKLHSEFNACASRARYLMGLERGKALNCKRVAKKYMKPARREARSQLGEKATLTEVDQLAEENEKVQPWLRRQERHEDRRDALKDLFDIYSENVTVLSRDWTMRGKEEAGS